MSSRFTRVLVAMMMCAVVASTGGRLEPIGVAAQDPLLLAELAENGPNGVVVESLAEGVTDALPPIPAFLVFERVELPVGPSAGIQVSSGPELILVEFGSLIITDDLGIEGMYDAGSQLLIPMGVPYQLRNDGSEAAVFFRLILIPETDRDESPAASASPIPGREAVAETIFSTDIVDLPAAAMRFFMARVTWEPGSEIEATAFPGPVAMILEDGELSVAGPSGIEGQLQPGRPIVFPANTPVRQRNSGEEPAVVLVIGAIPADASLFQTGDDDTTEAAEVESAETTDDSRAGSDEAESGEVFEAQDRPSSEEVAAAAVETAEPVEPAETETATDPVEAQAPPGVIYQATDQGGFEEWGASGPWKIFRGMLISDGTAGTILAPLELGGTVDIAIEAEIQSLGDSNGWFGLVARIVNSSEGVASRFDYYGADVIYVHGQNVAEMSRGFDNNWHTFRLEIDGNEIRLLVDGTVVAAASDNRLVTDEGGAVGIVVSDPMQINVRRFTVTSLAAEAAIGPSVHTQAATTSSDVVAVTTSEAQPSTAEAATGPGRAARIADMLPTAGEIPGGLVLTEDGKRTQDEITVTFPDPGDASLRFTEWDWKGCVYRYFGSPEGAIIQVDRTTFIDVSIHRFGSAESGSLALRYFMEARRMLLGIPEVSVEQVGDLSLGLAGASGGMNEATIYVQLRSAVIRVTGFSPQGDPMADVVQVAKVVIAK